MPLAQSRRSLLFRMSRSLSLYTMPYFIPVYSISHSFSSIVFPAVQYPQCLFSFNNPHCLSTRTVCPIVFLTVQYVHRLSHCTLYPVVFLSVQYVPQSFFLYSMSHCLTLCTVCPTDFLCVQYVPLSFSVYSMSHCLSLCTVCLIAFLSVQYVPLPFSLCLSFPTGYNKHSFLTVQCVHCLSFCTVCLTAFHPILFGMYIFPILQYDPLSFSYYSMPHCIFLGKPWFIVFLPVWFVPAFFLTVWLSVFCLFLVFTLSFHLHTLNLQVHLLIQQEILHFLY